MMVVCPKGETPPKGFTPLPTGFTTGPLPLPPSVGEAWVLTPIDELLGEIHPYINSTTFYLDKLVDARLATKIAIILRNTTGDAMTVQLVGHTENAPSDSNGLFNIGGTQVLAATGGGLSLEPDIEGVDWLPYMGVTILSDASAPTTGLISVRAVGRRWRNLVAQGQQA